MSDDFEDELRDDESGAIVMSALSEVLNICAGVAELQTTDEAAEDIYALCDLIAEYHGIERAVVITEEHEDGSYTTSVEDSATPRTTPIPGSIRTKDKPKLRVVDYTPKTPPKQ